MLVALVKARLVHKVLLARGAERAAAVPPIVVSVELVVVHAATPESMRGDQKTERTHTNDRDSCQRGRSNTAEVDVHW